MDLKIETQKFIEHVKQNYDPSKPLVFWIDLFCGAGGSRIACYELNYHFEGCEISKDMFLKQEVKFKNHIQNLFH
jgi:hypothetical protein